MTNTFSIEDLTGERANLSLALPFRARYRDGHFEENREIQPDVEQWLLNACRLYARGDAGIRERVRELCTDEDALWQLYSLAEKLTSHERARMDSADVENALVALSIEDRRYDPQDFSIVLRGVLRRARAAGVEVKPLLVRVALLSNQVANAPGGCTRDIMLQAAQHLSA